MRGIYTAIVTPFNRELEIDFDYFAELIRFQEQSKIQGVVVCGTNGEFPSLSAEECKRIIEAACRSRKKIEVIACVGRNSLKEALEICNFAGEKADGVLLIPPFYFKNASLQGLLSYFDRILDAVELPVMIYNIPKYTGNEITQELIGKLKSKHRNLIGVKDSSGKISTTQMYINSFPELSVLCGSDALILEALKAGASGAVSALSNAFPKKVIEIFDRFTARDFDAAERAQIELAGIREIIKKYPQRSAIKHALNFAGFEKSYVRPPLVDLEEGQIEALEREVMRWKS